MNPDSVAWFDTNAATITELANALTSLGLEAGALGDELTDPDLPSLTFMRVGETLEAAVTIARDIAAPPDPSASLLWHVALDHYASAAAILRMRRPMNVVSTALAILASSASYALTMCVTELVGTSDT